MTRPSPGNEPPLFSLLSDHPIESDVEKCDDLLDLHERLRVHLDTLRHPGTRTPFSIALYGDWGTGKTSAMRWLECQLRIWNDSDVRDRDTHPHITPVWFFPWKYHKREDVWRGIIAEVILATLKTGSIDAEDFSKKAVHVAKRYGKFLGSSFLHILANSKLRVRNKTSLGVPGVAKNETTAGIQLNGQAVRDIYDEYQKAAQPHAPFLNDFEEEMKHWVEQTFDDTSRRLVLFIDDLDRCLPEVALEVLEALKLYLNIPGLLFVAGLDDHVISQVIVSHYKKHEVDETKARQYLAKIFQVEYHMEPSDTKASGFLERRIRDLNQLTDGKWSECLPTAGPEVDQMTVRYRPAVEGSLRALGSSNPREFTRLLNSLLVRAVAAREMKLADRVSTPELRFAQGAQIFLIERFLIRHLDLGPARRNPLLNARFCQWLTDLSDTRIHHPQLTDIFQHATSPSMLDLEVTAQVRCVPEFLAIQNEAARIPHAPEALRILHEHAWDLLLIPFCPDIAAATAIAQVLPVDEKALESESGQIINTAIRKNLGLREDQGIGDEDRKKVSLLDLSGTSVRDLTPLQGLTGLQVLNLGSTEVSDLAPLQSLTGLQVLDLGATEVSDLIPLQSLTSLQSLDIEHTKVNVVTALSDLTNLSELYLSGTMVVDLEPLQNLKNLATLSLRSTQVRNLDALAKLIKLESLDLYGSHVGDVTALKSLRRLQSLDLRKTKVSDLSALHGLEECMMQLLIQGTPVSQNTDAIAALRKALPNTEINV